MGDNFIFDLVTVLVPMILALSVHEYFHAQSAYWLGDATAKINGRLTLNPLAHMDPIGTLGLPILAVLSHSSFFFGWAKPVPVNPVNFTRKMTMRQGMMITAAAGPVSNLVFGLVCLILLRLLLVDFAVISMDGAVVILLTRLIMINYVLAFFNFIPLPPLDGSRVLAGFAPRSIIEKLDSLERNPMISMVILIALMGTGLLHKIIGPPVALLWGLSMKFLGM